MGVISLGVPYWSWFAGGVGQCRWIHGDEDCMVCGVSRPRFVDGTDILLKISYGGGSSGHFTV